MAGILDNLRNIIIQDREKNVGAVKVDDKIALGVLLWAVASSDDKFLAREEDKIKEILIKHSNIEEKDLGLVLDTVKEAEKKRIDLYTFTSEIADSLSYKERVFLVEELFRVACVDRDLDERELELIRDISNLLHLSHSDFIDAKIRVKKEFGMDTVTS